MRWLCTDMLGRWCSLTVMRRLVRRGWRLRIRCRLRLVSMVSMILMRRGGMVLRRVVMFLI